MELEAQALAVGAPDPRLSAAIALAQGALAEASARNPFESPTRVGEANQALDRVFGATRDARERLMWWQPQSRR